MLLDNIFNSNYIVCYRGKKIIWIFIVLTTF